MVGQKAKSWGEPRAGRPHRVRYGPTSLSVLLILPTGQTALSDSIFPILPLPLALNPVLSLLQVVASDRGSPPRKKDHILQVTVLDVNDNPPVIESPFGYNVSVNEVRAALESVQLGVQGGQWV